MARWMMLTDLPENAIIGLNAALDASGFSACVLVDDGRDDPVALLARKVFREAREIIDRVAADMALDAKIYVCSILDTQQDFQACAVRLGEREYCIALWLAVPIKSAAWNSYLLGTRPAAELLSYTPDEYTTAVEPMGVDTFQAYEQLGLRPALTLGGPLDSLRANVDLCGFEWLVLHEMGHIVNGHLTVGKTLNSLSFILENDSSIDRDDNLTSHALEFDADCFAAQIAMQSAMRRPSVLEQVATSSLQEADKEESRLLQFMLGVGSIVRGFDHGPIARDDLFEFDHPSGGVRISYMHGQLNTIFLEENILFKSAHVPNLAGRVISALEGAISEATGLPSAGGNLAEAFELTWEEYYVPVLSRWAKLYPLLNAAKLTPFKLALPQYPPA